MDDCTTLWMRSAKGNRKPMSALFSKSSVSCELTKKVRFIRIGSADADPGIPSNFGSYPPGIRWEPGQTVWRI
jgi:hypothetical protein